MSEKEFRVVSTILFVLLFIKTCMLVLDISEVKEQVQELQTQIEIMATEDDNVYFIEPTCSLEYDYDYVVDVVAAESANQSIEGQMAVAQVIATRADEWGMTPEEVVKQKNQFASPNHSAVTEQVEEACERVLINGERVTDHNIKWFCSIDSFPKTHMSKDYVMTIGDHKFFK